MNRSFARRPDAAAQFVESIVDTIRGVVGGGDRAVPLHEPCFRGREWDYVKACLDSRWVSSLGDYVTRFEQQLVEISGCGHVVATVSGTSALHTCLLVGGVQRDDEVVVPNLSFVATANAVSYIGAWPHFVDCDAATLGIDAAALETHLREIAAFRNGVCYNRHTGRRLSALIAVHMFGHPCRIDAIAEVAARFGLLLIEDAAESLGSTYKGRHTGRWGRLAASSFNGNKTITTGGGGAVLTDDEDLARRARHLTTTAKVAHRWEWRHDRIAFNYRMPNLNAALGCAQLEQLPVFLESKRALAHRYARAFEGFGGVRFVPEPAGARSNYWLCALLLDEDRVGQLQPLLEQTHERGIMTRRAWHPLSALPMYEKCPRADVAMSASLYRRLINLPSSPGLLLAEA